MPNIIEQQDLLKGLPDNRLAMLLQNPVADIPPFLVAAEAQRRQAIRQQFQASAPQESVVDSLTKQLANVPQNIQAPAQQPPRMPQMAQTPQAQGVMALQQQPQQQPQQQAQPQQMRMGGVVQRYAPGGEVQGFRGRQGSSGYLPGEDPAESAVLPSVLGGVYDWAGSFLSGIDNSAFITNLKKYGLTPTPEQMAQIEADRAARTPEPEIAENVTDRGIAGVPGGASRSGNALPRRGDDPGKKDTSADNQDKPSIKPLAGETPDEYRARLEELMKAREPSDWEKAQRWFAMAGQFFDPSKTMGESIAGAGQAFAESSAELDRARRLSEFEYQKAMLEYDMGKSEEERAAAAEAAKDAREFKQRMLERGTPSADAAVASLDRGIREIDDQIAELRKSDMPGVPIPPENQTEIDRLLERRRALSNMMVGILDKGGFVNKNLVTQDELNALGPL